MPTEAYPLRRSTSPSSAELVNAAKADDDYAFVVDRTGRLIAHPDRNAVTGDTDMSGLPQVKAALAASGSGTIADAIADGAAPTLAAYAEVPGLGWTGAVADTPSRRAGALPGAALAIGAVARRRDR